MVLFLTKLNYKFSSPMMSFPTWYIESHVAQTIGTSQHQSIRSFSFSIEESRNYSTNLPPISFRLLEASKMVYELVSRVT